MLVSSGAIAAGLPPLRLRARPRDLATQQAAASVGQGLLVSRYTEAFARHGRTVGQVLLTADDLVRRTHYRNALRTLDKLLAVGAVPVVNENDTVATDEIRFGDNDRLAALVAHLVRADLLVLLSDVDGLYDGDPRRPGSRLVSDVRTPADLVGVDLGRPGRRGPAGVGTGGMQTKVDAARLATSSGIPALVTSADAGRRRAGGRGRRDLVPPDRDPAGDPAAVARARGHRARPAAPGRRGGARCGRAPAVAAARRHHRGRRRLRRR